MGNEIIKFQWLNGAKICNGDFVMKGDIMEMTCTDASGIPWGVDIDKICLKYRKYKTICVIQNIKDIVTITPTQIIIKLDTRKYGACHLCSVTLWSTRCLAKISLNQCNSLNINQCKSIKF